MMNDLGLDMEDFEAKTVLNPADIEMEPLE